MTSPFEYWLRIHLLTIVRVYNEAQKLLVFNASASHCITRGADRGTNKAAKANNKSIIKYSVRY